jgi:hypothetical protein
MDKPPYDDGGPAFPFDRRITTASENGPIETEVHAHQGISFADLIAALFVTSQGSTDNSTARAQAGYEMADALISFKRHRDQRVTEYWRAQAAKSLAMREQADKERAAQPSNG